MSTYTRTATIRGWTTLPISPVTLLVLGLPSFGVGRRNVHVEDVRVVKDVGAGRGESGQDNQQRQRHDSRSRARARCSR